MKLHESFFVDLYIPVFHAVLPKLMTPLLSPQYPIRIKVPQAKKIKTKSGKGE